MYLLYLSVALFCNHMLSVIDFTLKSHHSYFCQFKGNSRQDEQTNKHMRGLYVQFGGLHPIPHLVSWWVCVCTGLVQSQLSLLWPGILPHHQSHLQLRDQERAEESANIHVQRRERVCKWMNSKVTRVWMLNIEVCWGRCCCWRINRNAGCFGCVLTFI